MKVSSDRIIQDIEALRSFSSTPCDRGITRVSWTREYARGTDYIKRRMQQAGLLVWEDAIGNVCGRLEGKAGKGVIATGSHLDTVQCSGAYDGIQGIVCGIEAVRVLKENGIGLDHPLEIIAIAEEEGTRTGNVLTGSSYICRSLEREDIPELADLQGIPLKDIIRQYKMEQEVHVVTGPVFENPPMVFLEVHDEQGPVLEAGALDIGIVKRIRGIINFEIKLVGNGGHPGTVPMKHRKDCSMAAYEVCLRAERFVRAHFNEEATITTGKMTLFPGSGNSIPQEAVFTVDIRFSSQAIGEEIEKRVLEYLDEAAGIWGVRAELRPFARKMPVNLDKQVIDILDQVCQEMKIAYLPMDSGAGHDSMNFAAICPTAMIFSPCAGGVSHCVDEYVSPGDLERATEVLVKTIMKVDKEIG